MAVFGSGIVLLLNIWGGKRAGSAITDPAKEMADVHKAMKMLKSVEYRCVRQMFSVPTVDHDSDILADGTSRADFGEQ